MKPGFLAFAILLAVSGRSAAQPASGLGQRGIEAYHALDFAAAGSWLRQAIARTGPDAISDSARADLYVYLGASQLFQGNRQEAAEAFRKALETDPRFRPDTLVFPPEITGAFDAVRRRTLFVAVSLPRDTAFAAGAPRSGYTVRLHSSALHTVNVSLTRPDGALARLLYAGEVRDSLAVFWDGLAADGVTPLEDQLVLRVTSTGSAGETRTIRATLLSRAEPDPGSQPDAIPQSLLLPEHRPSSPGIEILGIGAIGGVLAIAIPAVFGGGGDRKVGYIVGASLGAAGVIGFLSRRPGEPLPENIAANRERREEWQRQAEARRTENERRRGVLLRVTVAEGIAVEP